MAPLPEMPRHRHKLHKSPDKGLERTLGQSIAPHAPKTVEIIDRIELLRSLRMIISQPLADLLVAAYHRGKPFIEFKGHKDRISFPEWTRLPQEAKALSYIHSSITLPNPLNYCLTVHIRDDDVAWAHIDKKGPSRLIGEFIDKKLGHIYRRAGANLSYMYVLETAPLYNEDDEGAFEKQRSKLDSFHYSLALHIPEQIYQKVISAIAKNGVTPRGELFRHNSGNIVHVAKIEETKSFHKGGSQTGRHGLAGRMDYAAKGFRCLHNSREFYKRLNPDSLPLDRWAFASNDIVSLAREQFTELRSTLRTPLNELWDSVTNLLPGDYTSELIKTFSAPEDSIETVKRICACDKELLRLRKAYSLIQDLAGVTGWKSL